MLVPFQVSQVFLFCKQQKSNFEQLKNETDLLTHLTMCFRVLAWLQG